MWSMRSSSQRERRCSTPMLLDRSVEERSFRVAPMPATQVPRATSHKQRLRTGDWRTVVTGIEASFAVSGNVKLIVTGTGFG